MVLVRERVSGVWQHSKRNEMKKCGKQMKGAINGEAKVKRGKISIEK